MSSWVGPWSRPPVATASMTTPDLLWKTPAVTDVWRCMDGLLIGRADELRQFDALLDATADGHGGLAIVSGPAGIGKSALLDRVVARARADGMTTLVADG